jgi:hypothetical protein
MKVAIHQPHYLPWLGYLAKWAAADLFIALDTVQYAKNGWQNRNRIKTRDGGRWLTVPVRAHLGAPITDVAIDATQPWPRRHWRAIEQAYARAPFFPRYGERLASFYERKWSRLAPLAVASAEWLGRAVGITTPMRLASELGVTTTDPTGRLVALCRSVGADTYLAGPHGAEYMDVSHFAAAGIRVLSQVYDHPIYPQLHGAFVPSLSALDALLMTGDAALSMLRGGDAWSPIDTSRSRSGAAPRV